MGFSVGTTQQLADALKKDIESAWKGSYTDPNTGTTYAVSTTAMVSVADPKAIQGSPVPNQIYVSTEKERSSFDYKINKGTNFSPRYLGRFALNCDSRCRKHETGHVLGLGDDYYESTQEAVPGHAGHLMAGGNTGEVVPPLVET